MVPIYCPFTSIVLFRLHLAEKSNIGCMFIFFCAKKRCHAKQRRALLFSAQLTKTVFSREYIMSFFGSSFGASSNMSMLSTSSSNKMTYAIDTTQPQALIVNVPMCEDCPLTSVLLDTGSHNTILRPSTCDSMGLQSDHVEHAERFLAGKTLEHGTQGPVNFPLFPQTLRFTHGASNTPRAPFPTS